MKKVIRLGMIGAGNFSRQHLLGLNEVKIADVVAICDVVKENAERRAKEFNIPDVYTNHHELLKRKDIDAVVLPLPDQVHAEIAIDAMRAGKHVLCEKPMALNLDECKEMVRVSRETGMQLMVGQIGRYTPAFVKAKELVEQGAIGELFFIESEYAHDYSSIGGEGGWRVTPEREPIIGGGCHAVDLIRMIAGDPEEVFAYANNMSLVDWPIHDCCVGIMKFPSGAIGKVMTSTGCKRRYTMRTVIQGTKGTLILDNVNATISLFKEEFSDCEELKAPISQQTVEMRIPIAINNHNFAAEVTDFCKCLLENRPVTTDGVQGASTVAVCTAIVESFKTGEKIKLDYNF